MKILESNLQQLKQLDTEYKPYIPLSPTSLEDAIKFYILHTTLLYNSYNFLLLEYRTNNKIPQFQSLIFEVEFKLSFSCEHFYDYKKFTEFVTEFVIKEHDENILKKSYNIISLKLKDLRSDCKRLNYNCNYSTYSTLFQPHNIEVFSFINEIQYETDENGNYKLNDTDYFTSDSFFYKIIGDIDECIKKIDSIFSIKELNKLNQTEPKRTTIETPSKPIEPIVWTGDNVLLGYLIQWLKDNHYVSKKTSRDTVIKNHFVDDKGKPIVNIKQGLQSMRDLNDGQVPKDFDKIKPLLNVLTDLKDIFK